MTFCFGTCEDSGLLAELNAQLIQDEGHGNPMTVAELDQRMKRWLEGGYRAVIYRQTEEVVAYAVFREEPQEIHLRQFFVVRHRRRQGLGRAAFELLRSEIWPAGKRLTVDVLASNRIALDFWRSVGYADYCLTLEILPPSAT